jgi:Ca-activated chloride channel homolog
MLESLQQFHFLRPWWFLALIPAAWLVWQLTRTQAQGDHWTRLIAPHLLPFLLDGKGAEEKNRVGWLLAPIVVAVVALAGPTWHKLPNPVEKNTSALVVLWDMSPSMLAQDIRPSRLERSRLKLIDLLKTRKDGLTALIAYSGEAYVVTPLTEDVQTIINLLPSLAPTTLPSVGSNPEMALSEAKKLLKAGNFNHGDILFLTDGIDSKAFDNLDEQLNNSKDRITLWGIGSEEGAPIPLPRGGFLQTGKDLVIAKLNSSELKRFAEQHNGYYVPAQADDGDIKFLSQLLARTDQTQIQSDKTFDQWVESGQYLSLALLPLCLWLFRRGSLLIILVALALPNPLPVSAATPAQAPTAEEPSAPAPAPEPAWQKDLRNGWNGLWFTPDQQGARLLKKGDAPAAAEHFANPAWQATAQYQAGNFAAAAKTFSQDTSATGNYNQGTALLKKGDYDGAIKAFEEALKQQPTYAAAQHNKDIATKLKALKAKQPKQNNGQKDPNQKQNGDKDQQNDQQKDPESQDGEGESAENNEQAGDKQKPEDSSQDQDQNGKSEDQSQQNKKDPSKAEPNQDQQDDEKQAQADDDKKPEDEEKSEQAKQSAEEKAAAQQKAQEEYAKQLAEAAKDQQEGAKPADTGASAEDSKEQQENQQKIDQALRRVPDDPGGLLRNKFQYQYKERRMNPQAPKDANNNPENRW